MRWNDVATLGYIVKTGYGLQKEMDSGKERKAVRRQDAQIAITPTRRGLPLSLLNDQDCLRRILVTVDGGGRGRDKCVLPVPQLTKPPSNGPLGNPRVAVPKFPIRFDLNDIVTS